MNPSTTLTFWFHFTRMLWHAILRSLALNCCSTSMSDGAKKSFVLLPALIHAYKKKIEDFIFPRSVDSFKNQRSMRFWCLNCYIFLTIKRYQLSIFILHTTPFLYGRVKFGALHKRGTSWGSIPSHLQVLEHWNRFKFGVYVEGSCRYWFVLFVNFYLIRYGDTAVQS